MRLGAARRDQLVVQAPRHRKVGEAVAVDVPHLLLAVEIFGASKTVRLGGDARPRPDLLPDLLARCLHIDRNRLAGPANPGRLPPSSRRRASRPPPRRPPWFLRPAPPRPPRGRRA